MPIRDRAQPTRCEYFIPISIVYAGESQDRSPLRTSRSAAHQSASRRQSKEPAAVSLSPPRSRYRFDRLPPEEQNSLDRRMRERRELEVGAE